MKVPSSQSASCKTKKFMVWNLFLNKWLTVLCVAFDILKPIFHSKSWWWFEWRLWWERLHSKTKKIWVGKVTEREGSLWWCKHCSSTTPHNQKCSIVVSKAPNFHLYLNLFYNKLRFDDPYFSLPITPSINMDRKFARLLRILFPLLYFASSFPLKKKKKILLSSFWPLFPFCFGVAFFFSFFFF